MSKIAIISQPGQGVLIDVSGCTSAEEAAFHLSSTFQVPSGLWNDTDLDLNFGALDLDRDEAAKLLAVANDAGVIPRQVFSDSPKTQESLGQLSVVIAGPFSMHSGKSGSGAMTEHQAEDAVGDMHNAGKITTALMEPPASFDRSLLKAVSKAEMPSKAAASGVLYLKQNLRSGQSVNHSGHLVIIGDVNPGAEVMADGDITVWGSLRGVAHAGMSGNTNAEIRALRIEAIQLRIASAIARAPDHPHNQVSKVRQGPETARMSGGVIKIVSNVPLS